MQIFPTFTIDKRSDQIWQNKPAELPTPRTQSTPGEKVITVTTVTASSSSSSSLKAALKDSKHSVKRAKSLTSSSDHSPNKGPMPPKMMGRSASAHSSVRARSHSPVRASSRSPSQIEQQQKPTDIDLRSSMASLNSSMSSFAGDEDEFAAEVDEPATPAKEDKAKQMAASIAEEEEDEKPNKRGWTSQAKSFFKVAGPKSSYKTLKDEPGADTPAAATKATTSTCEDPKRIDANRTAKVDSTASAAKKYVLTITLEETSQSLLLWVLQRKVKSEIVLKGTSF